MGEESGEVPFTCFMAKESYLKNKKETVESFTKAVSKAIKYIMETNEDEVAKALLNQFPSTELQSIKDSIASYKRIDAWKTNLSMTESDFNRLQNIMINAGELTSIVDYGKLVDNTIAEKTYKEVLG